MEQIYQKVIETAFQNAENGISKITPEIIQMEGMSGTKTRHFYNNLLHTQPFGFNPRYLEIGTWKGSSVCSAMCGNKAKVVCIDNWSEFNGPKDEFLKNFHTYKGENDANFIESDSFQVNVDDLPKFNIYLYDGNHTVDCHYLALLHYYNCLDDTFIFIVDDWNCLDVRLGTLQAIKNLKLNVLFEKNIRLTYDNTHTPHHLAKTSWWNGIYAAVLQKNN